MVSLAASTAEASLPAARSLGSVTAVEAATAVAAIPGLQPDAASAAAAEATQTAMPLSLSVSSRQPGI